MKLKISKTGTQSRDEALAGAMYVAEAIESTMGPFGMNFLIEKRQDLSNDGYKISSELCSSIENEFQREGAKFGHEACAKTNDKFGDATSTTWSLWKAITKEVIRLLPNDKSIIAKKTASEIRRDLSKSMENVFEKLDEMTEPIKSEEELISATKVSVEDDELAELIGKTQWKLGPEGHIIAEETAETSSSIEIVRGIRIDSGMGAPIMINNPEKGTLEINEACTILTNYTIGSEELMRLKEKIFTPLYASGKKAVIIISRGFTSDAIKICETTTNAGLGLIPINAPYTNQAQMMKDMETVLGGRYIDQEQGDLMDMQLSDVGWCERLVAGRFDAIVTGTDNEEAKKRVEKRVERLKNELKGEQSDFGKKMLEERISQLQNGFAILKVGAITSRRKKYLKDKADDAVNTVRNALKGGTVKGGGLAFKEISEQLEQGDILKNPLLCINQVITLLSPKDFIIEDWVRDPVIVLKGALRHAIEGAADFATINGVITSPNPKKKDEETD